MNVLFDDELFFAYGFAWFDTGVGSDTELVSARGGQANGILGAAEPGLLSMVIGMHSGRVPVRVELHEVEPEVEDGWDDVVEASLAVRGPDATLSTFDDFRAVTLPASGWYRARWHDDGADAGRQNERFEVDEPVVERCLLQLWPAAPAPDLVVRETSTNAAYWRTEGAAATPPAPVEERAYAERAEQQARAELDRRAKEEREREWYLLQWGGRDPSPRLLTLGRTAPSLAREHRDLVDALAQLPPDRARDLALDLTAEVCRAAAGGPDWRPALEALRRSDPLPAPFRTPEEAYRAAFPGPSSVVVTFARVSAPPAREQLSHVSAAVGAVLAASAADPLEAVLGVVDAVSWSAPDLDAFFADVGRRVASAD